MFNKNEKHPSVILFDFGAVLVGLDKQRCINALQQVGLDNIASYVDEHRSEDLFHRLELGGSTEEFCREARERSNGNPTDAEVAWAWEQLLTGVPLQKLQRIRQLRQRGYRTAVLSNTNWIHWNQALRDFFSIEGLTIDDYFDHVFLSCDLRMVKPDPRIYEAVADTMQCRFDEILFIDDSARNCKGARSKGIHTYHDPTGNDWIGLTATDEGIMKMMQGNTAQPSACIIGNFDGVHLGHRHIINRLKEIGQERNLHTIAVTFNTHPRALFDSSFTPSYLTTIEEKTALLRESGIDEVRVIPFTREFAGTTARDFMKYSLRDEMGVKVLLLGYDNRFGKRNMDEDFHAYEQYGKEFGIEVLLAEAVDVEEQGENVRVSSSHIRHLIAEGRVEEATQCLGRHFCVSGTVVHGHEEGRRMGFPTANIMPQPTKLLPPNGAYETMVTVEGSDAAPMQAMTNIGYRPTFKDEKAITIETNIFDFTGDLYDKDITIAFVRKIRDEQAFPSTEALRQQLIKDREEVRGFKL